MISRDWLTRWFTTKLEAAQQPDALITPMANAMSQELMEKWLAQEAAFWLSAAGRPNLSLQQRTMRLSVSRFYDDRLSSVITASRDRDATPEEES